jgi:[acyl-carrier-protein] S-malonyltransferase
MSVVATVGGTPVDESEVDLRERELRAGPVRNTLPRPHTSEGRQLRRWLVQVLVAERLVAEEAAARRLSGADAPDLAAIAPDRAAMLGLGSVAADLLTRDPVARAVFRAVTAELAVSDADVERYYRANPERYRHEERRVVRHAVTAAVGAPAAELVVDRPLRTVRRGELSAVMADAVFGADVGTVVGPVRDPVGTHVVLVEEVVPAHTVPLADVHDEIAAHLLGAVRRRAFTAWLDQRAAEVVALSPGFEHPGDPRQPDNTHRH